MAVSYNKLWKLLVDKKMSKSDLRKKAEIAPNTMTKLRRDEEVSLTILSKICKTLNADFGDIVEYVPDAEIWDLYDENRELLGKDHVRGEQQPIDGYHLVVHVWIRNSKLPYRDGYTAGSFRTDSDDVLFGEAIITIYLPCMR